MQSFTFYNPTKIYFGENQLESLVEELKQVGPVVCLTYGTGSIKKSGLYDKIRILLENEKKTIVELSNITPNPRHTKVEEGIALCRKHNVDFLLAVGGGSVVDCTKLISAGMFVEGDFWHRLVIKKESIEKALPIGVVLTMAATGSEMNNCGVISNLDQKLKRSYSHDLLFPKFSILDPTITYTLPKKQMINGAIDTLSHIFESYFSNPNESNVSDDIAEALMKNVMHNITIALENPYDYNARSNLMWDSTLALNGLIEVSKDGDWMGHQLQHVLSAYYDIAHGEGLAIVHPEYLKKVCVKYPEKFVRFACNVFNVSKENKRDAEIALEGIDLLQQFFKKIGAKTTLKEVGIDSTLIPEMSKTVRRLTTSYGVLTVEEIEEIYHSCQPL